jgi:hypothetical protein
MLSKINFPYDISQLDTLTIFYHWLDANATQGAQGHCNIGVKACCGVYALQFSNIKYVRGYYVVRLSRGFWILVSCFELTWV